MWIEAKTGGGGGGGQTLTPSNSSPATITNGENYTADGSGLAVETISNITPGATPAAVADGSIYKMLGAGKVVDAITDITPGSTPAAVTSGLTYRMGGAGKLVDQIIDLTPSSSPQGVTAGVTYKMGATGKVVDAIPDVTPSSSGQYFTAGAKNMTSSGYAYSQQPVGTLSIVEAVSQVPNAATFTIGHSLTVGKTYHLLITNAAASAANAKTATAITVSSGASNLTEVNNVSGFLGSSAYYSSLIYYTFVATSQTVSFSKAVNARRSGYILFEV